MEAKMSRQNVRYPFVVVLVTVVLMLVMAQPLAAKDDTGESEVEGTVLSIDAAAGTFQVQGKDGEVYVIIPPAGFDLSSLKVGDVVEVKGTLNENGSISALSIKIDRPHDDVDKTGSYYCVQSEVQHPAGARLATSYDMPYEDLQAWFCQGFGWGQIKLALQTAKLTGVDAADLLQARLDGKGWGQIWQGLYLVGRSRHDKPSNDKEGGLQSGGAGGSNVTKAKGKPVPAGGSDVTKAKGKPVPPGGSNGVKANGKPVPPGGSDGTKENGKPADDGHSNNGKGKK
jgi:Domain of unknown function (DUF5666)